MRDAAVSRSWSGGFDAGHVLHRRNCRGAAEVQSAFVLVYRQRSSGHLVFGRADDSSGPALAGPKRELRPSGAEQLRFIRSCSAALAPQTMADIEERFGVPILEAYGMTEAAHQMASNPLPPGARKPGSVGRGTAVRIAILNKGGDLLPRASTGEVSIKGPNVFGGYEGNAEANANHFPMAGFAPAIRAIWTTKAI